MKPKAQTAAQPKYRLRAFLPADDVSGRFQWRFYAKGQGFVLPPADELLATAMSGAECSRVFNSREGRKLRIVADSVESPEPMTVVELVMLACRDPIVEAAKVLADTGMSEDRLQYTLQRYCRNIDDAVTTGITNAFRDIQRGCSRPTPTPAQVRRKAVDAVKRVDFGGYRPTRTGVLTLAEVSGTMRA